MSCTWDKKYLQTENIEPIMAPEFVLCVKRKYQYPVKPIFCLFWERYPISGKLQDEYNYNRQIDAEKERGREGFSLEDN